MSTPAVTIGISFFNSRGTILDTVRSVFAQTFTDWELILIDDGSTDGSLDVLRGLDDPRVRIICDGVNRGVPDRLNQINQLGRAPLLARMDGDDLMHPRRIERQVAFLEAHRDIDAIDTTIFTMDNDLTPLGLRGAEPLDCRPEVVLRQGVFFQPAVMARRAWFLENPYDRTYVRAEDRELWCRTFTHSRFARLCEPLLFYREGLAGNLRNYLRTAATVRRILSVYGPPVLGSWKTRWLIGRMHLQGFAYRLATVLGLQGHLIRGRNRPLGAAELQNARGTIAQILNTRVPGIDRIRSREEVAI